MNLAENLDVEMKETQSNIEPEEFIGRHIGPRESEVKQMLEFLGFSDLDSFISQVVPRNISQQEELQLAAFPKALSEIEAIQRLRSIVAQNKVFKSYIGQGYNPCLVPTVIQRNILENPGWYTQYTPYQAEISQGRLEAMLNFQTMIIDLTALAIANASMLDEGTAAAEAMSLSLALAEKDQSEGNKRYFISSSCYSQTIAVVRTRAEALGVEVIVGDHSNFDFAKNKVFGVLLQYPDANGAVVDYREFINQAHAHKALVSMACDLLSLCLLTPPGELGADIAVGSAQRFGVPLGFGGPHAAFFATRDEYKRLMPGRLVGISKDSSGRPALRLALQTREQHIRRERATSNICTAQVLLAVMASMYAVYHGPDGLKRIALSVHEKARRLANALRAAGVKIVHANFFDTIQIELDSGQLNALLEKALAQRINLRKVDAKCVAISLDETTSQSDLEQLAALFGAKLANRVEDDSISNKFERKSEFLKQDVFNKYHSETEFLRYLKRLEAKDLSLAQSMISLGSCTMKLNATTEMLGLSWEEISSIHPFVPVEQAKGYMQLFKELEDCLKAITGFSAVSLQPNAGSQGEYAGILAIRAYQKSQNAADRNICLIPRSAHGTNPASAAMASLEVVVVECDKDGNIDLSDLKQKIESHRDKLSLLMVTYPSTHGVFEEGIKQACDMVHAAGGQVYMDGANLNALVGLCRPNDIGADVCHINLHKTFCIPHGGGGPGMGPIATKQHLAEFLPGHPVIDLGTKVGPVSASPWGSASILTISWAYMAMMGGAGLKRASQIAILNANYIAKRLNPYFPLVYKGKNGLIAHECILDLRQFKATSAIEVEDVAKRLMDYGFHAPTISFPVPGTMMVEPTESESKQELDRFCDAMVSIFDEIRAVENGSADKANNLLKNAPHTALNIASDEWSRPYSREQAAFPAAWTKEHKFWPAVGRVDGAYGDRNLVCSCGSLSEI